ncbi:hypothetical protein Bbelb_264290 [Branchiostoma belcheri]|nr:hypothetical protein Bbelb_264290 [Branchiostoma belcheri]
MAYVGNSDGGIGGTPRITGPPDLSFVVWMNGGNEFPIKDEARHVCDWIQGMQARQAFVCKGMEACGGTMAGSTPHGRGIMPLYATGHHAGHADGKASRVKARQQLDQQPSGV